MQENIHPHDDLLSKAAKETLLNQKAKLIWMTGLSGSGKTTVAKVLEKKLHEQGFLTKLLDGDNIRTGISNNLSFSADDRQENIRRISEVCKLFVEGGVITLASFVSPTNVIRKQIMEIVGPENVQMVLIDTPVEVCEQRDVKGLYAKARKGLIPNFTGISAPFDVPDFEHLAVPTVDKTIEESAQMILDHILPQIRQENKQ